MEESHCNYSQTVQVEELCDFTLAMTSKISHNQGSLVVT